MCSYDSLENFTRTNWALVHHHKWEHDSLMNMLVWERQVYVALTESYLREENERLKLERMTRR